MRITRVDFLTSHCHGYPWHGGMARPWFGQSPVTNYWTASAPIPKSEVHYTLRIAGRSQGRSSHYWLRRAEAGSRWSAAAWACSSSNEQSRVPHPQDFPGEVRASLLAASWGSSDWSQLRTMMQTWWRRNVSASRITTRLLGQMTGVWE
jgi:hypothetical protein